MKKTFEEKLMDRMKGRVRKVDRKRLEELRGIVGEVKVSNKTKNK